MNKPLLSTDIFQIENERPISNVDVELLTDLYLPIVGSDGLAIYLKLSRYKEDKPRAHSQLFEAIGITSGNFVLARKKLEGVGLLETRLIGSDKNFQMFLYVINTPVSGKKFLGNELLRNTLLKSTSREYINWLEVVYKLTKTKHVEGGTNISENFSDVFHSEEGGDLVASLKGESSSRKVIKTYFNIEKFIGYLNKNVDCINLNFFSRAELVKIEELAVLYHYGEEATADILISSIDYSAPKGKRIDFASFKDELVKDQGMSYMKADETKSKDKIVISGSNDVAKMMREMQNSSPETFLTKKQGGGLLPKSDLVLIETLREMNLKDPVINALLDYVLELQDGSLPTAYVTKIAGSLARKQFDNAIDAYNYLHKTGGSKKDKIKTETVVLNETDKGEESEDSDLLDMFKED